jgi:glucosamine-6-phosphate deaminase
MKTSISPTKQEMARAAATDGANLIRAALDMRGSANIIVATGASQFEMLEHLVAEPNINWNQVTIFHLDEYVGLPLAHPASFRLYLWQRFHSKLPLPVKAFHYIDAETVPQATCKQLGAIIENHPIDVAFIGIGENAHIAFNDPPANFTTDDPYLVVNLDEACRRQQMGEGWFRTLNDVPPQAISMSPKQIMKSRSIICTVPDQRKAQAVKDSLKGPVTNKVPASILQQHNRATIYLDAPAASLLT